MSEVNEKPEKLEFGQWFAGKTHPLWLYRELPEGMTPATLSNLYPGRAVLFQVQVGPDAGSWYSCYFAGSYVPVIRDYLRRGIPVYVQ